MRVCVCVYACVLACVCLPIERKRFAVDGSNGLHPIILYVYVILSHLKQLRSR